MENYKQSNLRYLWTLVNIGSAKSEKKVENCVYLGSQFLKKLPLYPNMDSTYRKTPEQNIEIPDRFEKPLSVEYPHLRH
jgi:hypothetical protein